MTNDLICILPIVLPTNFPKNNIDRNRNIVSLEQLCNIRHY